MPMRKILTRLSLRAIAAGQQGFDVVYPAIGDHLDFLNRLRDNQRGGASFIKTPRRCVLLALCKKGIFQF